MFDTGGRAVPAQCGRVSARVSGKAEVHAEAEGGIHLAGDCAKAGSHTGIWDGMHPLPPLVVSTMFR